MMVLVKILTKIKMVMEKTPKPNRRRVTVLYLYLKVIEEIAAEFCHNDGVWNARAALSESGKGRYFFVAHWPQRAT